MATCPVAWPWLYRMQTEDSVELKAAHADLVEDETDLADLDFTTDEYQNTVGGCVAYIAGKVINESAPKNENTLEVNFKDQVVKLPDFVATLHSVDPQVKAKDIRYVSVVSGAQEGVPCDDRVVLLSIWIAVGRAVVNIYLRLPSVKDSLLLVSSVSKLLYEASGKSAVRLEKFGLIRTGAVSVSKCSVEERDARDKQGPVKAKKNDDEHQNGGVNGMLETDAVGKKEESEEGEGATDERGPLEERKMFFALDAESLCLFDHPLSPKAVWDFRFYKESAENAIDVIYVCNVTGQLEIEQQQKVFYIGSSNTEGSGDKNFEFLSDTLRKGTMKPKPQEIFADLQKFVQFFEESKPSIPKVGGQKREGPGVRSNPSPPRPPPSDQRLSTPCQAGGDLAEWLANLLTGSHLQSSEEELQVLWFQLEDELHRYCRGNLIPEAPIESAGMNPDSPDQLMLAVEDIKEKLRNGNLQLALAHIRGMMNIYGESLLRPIASLDDVEILKRIFFLSG